MSHLLEAVSEKDHRTGNLQAKVTVVEYGDYECPHCGAAHPVVQALLKRYGDRICFAFRNFPLTEVHPHAAHAAEAAEFAGRHGKFWEMHDTIFEHQSHLGDAALASYAKHVGLRDSELLESLAAGDDRARVSHDFSTGVRSGVNGTPTFFINGARHDEAPTFEDLAEAIEHALGRD